MAVDILHTGSRAQRVAISLQLRDTMIALHPAKDGFADENRRWKWNRIFNCMISWLITCFFTRLEMNHGLGCGHGPPLPVFGSERKSPGVQV